MMLGREFFNLIAALYLQINDAVLLMKKKNVLCSKGSSGNHAAVPCNYTTLNSQQKSISLIESLIIIFMSRNITLFSIISRTQSLFMQQFPPTQAFHFNSHVRRSALELGSKRSFSRTVISCKSPADVV